MKRQSNTPSRARQHPLLLVAAAAWLLLGRGFAHSVAAADNIFDSGWTFPVRDRATIPPSANGGESPPVPLVDTPTTRSVTSEPVPPAANTAAAHPIPSLADQAASRKLFKELFATQLSDRSPQARRELAAKLLDQEKTIGDASSDRFVLLTGAAGAAKEGGDLALCCRAINLLSDSYEVDGLHLKSDTATAMTLHQSTTPLTDANCRAGLIIVDQLMANEDFAAASRLISHLRDSCSGTDLLPQIQSQLKKNNESKAASERIAVYRQKLKSAPDDPAANYELGRYLCLFKSDWTNGLPLLTKRPDTALGNAAALDLAAGDDTQKQLATGDGWWAEGEKETGGNQLSVRRRAAHWYTLVLNSGTPTGLKGALLQKRLDILSDDELANGPPDSPAGQSPVNGAVLSPPKGPSRYQGKYHYSHLQPNFSRADYAPYIDEPPTKLLDGVLERSGQVGWQGAKPNLIEFDFEDAAKPRSVWLWFRGNETDKEVNVPKRVTVWSSSNLQTAKKLGELTGINNVTGWIQIPLAGSSRQFVLDIEKTSEWTILGEVDFR